MAAVITVVFRLLPERVVAFDALLSELSSFIRASRPDGMDAVTILRGDEHVLVQATWRSPGDQRAFRASPTGSRIFKAMSDCSAEPPATYTSAVDEALSYRRDPT